MPTTVVSSNCGILPVIATKEALSHVSPIPATGVTFIANCQSFIAIITVVAAILFPVFQKVRDYPHHGGCASNMKQLGLALTQYTQDSDDSFPAGANAAGNGWAGKLYPFVKSTGVYQCPDDPQEGKFISYAENQNLVKQSLNNLTAPAATVALYESTTLGCDLTLLPKPTSTTGLSAPQDSKRHDEDTPQTAPMASTSCVCRRPRQVSDAGAGFGWPQLPSARRRCRRGRL